MYPRRDVTSGNKRGLLRPRCYLRQVISQVPLSRGSRDISVTERVSAKRTSPRRTCDFDAISVVSIFRFAYAHGHGRNLFRRHFVSWPRSRIRHRFSAASVSAARPQTVSAAGGCNIKYLAISGRMLPLSTVARAPPPPLPRSIARVEYSRPRARCIRTRDTHRCLMRASRPASVRVATPECVT